MKTTKSKTNKKRNTRTSLNKSNELLSKNPKATKKKFTIKSFYLNIAITIILILSIAPTMNFTLISEWVGLIFGSFLSSLVIGYVIKLTYKVIKTTDDGGIF
ncbi:hypothetical protein [Clostridium cellulovorans]|uniref:Uncharacterized protein n=1 Tax=Clostridium cellulovorans (strain ATCC 35296 / DSM 3052 / OCM 3 / 743B) TaxID=573061 RepID=D9SST2_CLOC7|nr:hypothetical protein [Clostridium cellulovorans]ADL52594.1 hypothetical protein Clocel_2899 [Clostridium cellulovorans 743B]